MSKTYNEKRIERICNDLLEESNEAMKGKIQKAIDSGALDISGWDENKDSMIIPRIIMQAVLETEAKQYSATGTIYEKQIKKEVKNLLQFL